MKKNIVLVGLMGSGKSTIGRFLADRLNYEFLDTDSELVNRTGVKIATIFEIVVATGGGIVISEENRKLLRMAGNVVYLRASEDILFSRLESCKDRPLLDRPLLQNGDRRQIIRKLLENTRKTIKTGKMLKCKSGSIKTNYLI